jgi:hypothetical protein
MNDASRRKLAEIRARVASGKKLYQLERECNEFLMLSLTEFDLEKSDSTDNRERYNCDAKADAANHVEGGNAVISLVNRLKRVAKNLFQSLFDFPAG